jgi:DNA ligase (NAD+)
MLTATDRLTELRDLIRNYDHWYYVKDAAKITDADYDTLYKELVELEARNPELTDPNSPTKRVGGIGSSGFIKTKHERRMLSLKNTFSASDVINYFKVGEELVVEPKVDGLSLKLVYKDGQLVQAITRGNGEFGDDVTENARTIRTIPLVLENAIDIEVTGEVYMEYSVFNALNDKMESEGEEPFANARNAAGGTLKLKDPAEVASRHLSFVVHGCFTEFEGVDTQWGLIELLEGQGFQSVFGLPTLQSCPTVAGSLTLSTPAKLAREIEGADTNRKFLNLATDGLVFKINDLAKQRELGEGNKYPNWAVAYKFPPERKSTTLLGVTLQVGKSGRVTPVAELKPVNLSGTLVRRASLCNQAEINRLGINLDDEVWVEKSAEIIPKVMGVAEKITGGVYEMDELCPCCQTKLVKEEGLVDLYCPNRDCDEQVFGRLKYAVGKSALDMDGCGDAMLRELMTHGVRKLSDLMTLKDIHFLKKSARQKLMEGRETAKKQVFWRQLNALGIEGIGAQTCQNIAAAFSSLISVFDEEEHERFKRIFKDDGDDSSKYIAFMNFMRDEENAAELNRLEAAGITFETAVTQIGKLTGKTFAITGALMSGSRDQMMRRIEACGGMVKPNVSAKCQYLVVGTDGGRLKAEKAEKLGVPTITEEQLYAMMGAAMPVAEAVDPDKEY